LPKSRTRREGSPCSPVILSTRLSYKSSTTSWLRRGTFSSRLIKLCWRDKSLSVNVSPPPISGKIRRPLLSRRMLSGLFSCSSFVLHTWTLSLVHCITLELVRDALVLTTIGVVPVPIIIISPATLPLLLFKSCWKLTAAVDVQGDDVDLMDFPLLLLLISRSGEPGPLLLARPAQNRTVPLLPLAEWQQDSAWDWIGFTEPSSYSGVLSSICLLTHKVNTIHTP